MGLPGISADVELTTINCGSCAGVYALSEKYRKHAETTGATWQPCHYVPESEE